MCAVPSEGIRVKVIKSKMEAGERIMDELIPRLDNSMESERDYGHPRKSNRVRS